MTAWKDKSREEKQKARDRSYARFLAKKCVYKQEQLKKKAAVIKYPSTFTAWIFPLDGEPIMVGPFKNKKVVLKQRFQIIQKLAVENNARESDLRSLVLYLDGSLDDSE